MTESDIDINQKLIADPGIEAQLKDLPEFFPVVVIMQRRPNNLNQWSEFNWEAIGVMASSHSDKPNKTPQLVYEEAEIKHYLYSGFKVRLYADECESYYYNLISPTPRSYVIARYSEDNIPEPFFVTMSFDDAHAYMETDELIYAVDVPPELYRWTENFVLLNYAPEKRKKRKRDDWKEQDKKIRV